jgi:ribosomal protein S18 acetylase RimI-like enzyme
MDKLIIRTYENKDKNEVIKLWQDCNLIFSKNDPEIEITSKINFQPDLFFVGLLNKKLIASIMVGYEGHRGWINYLAVNPKYQRRGFGRKLMDYATRILSDLHCQKINVQVRESNIDTIEFYKKLGYKNDKVISFGKRMK